MADELSKGDRVSWNTPQGRTRGNVDRAKDAATSSSPSQHFTASADEPAYIVESEKSGDRAAHKRSALRKLG